MAESLDTQTRKGNGTTSNVPEGVELGEPVGGKSSSVPEGIELGDPTPGQVEQQDNTPPKHLTAMAVEGKARQVQQAIENVPQQLHDAVFSKISKYLPKSVVNYVDSLTSNINQEFNPLSPVTDALSGIPQIVKGAAQGQQGGSQVARGVANVLVGGAKALSPLAPDAGREVKEGAQAAKGLFTPKLEQYGAQEVANEVAPTLEKAAVAPPPVPLEAPAPPIPLEELPAKPASFEGEQVQPKLQQAMQSVIDSLKHVDVPHPSQIQPEFQQGLHDIIDTATRQGGSVPEPGQSLTGKIIQLAQDARQKAKQIYQTIDNVTGDTDLKSMDDAIDKLKKRIGKADFDKRAALREQLRGLQESFDLVWDKVKSQSGLGQTDLELADNIHRKYRALQDVSQAFTKATRAAKYGETGVADANGIQQILDPTGLYQRLSNLQNATRYGGQRLTAAFGPELSQQILDHAAGGLRTATEISGQAREAIATNRQNTAALENYLAKIEQANKDAVKEAKAATDAITEGNKAAYQSAKNAVVEENKGIAAKNAAESQRYSDYADRVNQHNSLEQSSFKLHNEGVKARNAAEKARVDQINKAERARVKDVNDKANAVIDQRNQKELNRVKRNKTIAKAVGGAVATGSLAGAGFKLGSALAKDAIK